MAESLAEDIAIDLFAGGVGGALGVILGQPFDFVKVRLQTLGTAYTGPFDVLRKTVREEGMRGIYRGLLPPVMNSFLLNAIMFGGYRHGMSLTEDSSLSHGTRSFLAGSYSGLISVAALVPTDLVKCQLQMDRAGGRVGQYRSDMHCAREVLARTGVQGMYRGVLITAVRDSPTTGVYFVMFEQLERRLPEMSSAFAGESATFFAGGFSGIAAWALAYPADTIKTYLQTLPLATPAHERTIAHAARTIVIERGVSYFYRGLGTCLVRAFPVNAVTFVVYKRLKAFLS
jgi:hypothetical protein